jgi:hypothetical protein
MAHPTNRHNHRMVVTGNDHLKQAWDIPTTTARLMQMWWRRLFLLLSILVLLIQQGWRLAQTTATTTTISHDNMPSSHVCRVVIENKVDFHYETLESIALRYPLPRLTTCPQGNNDTVIVFDFALALQSSRIAVGERQGWERYFYEHLSQQKRQRIDGRWIQYGALVNMSHYTYSYDAYIGASCDYYNYPVWMNVSQDRFCVLHRVECEDTKCTPEMIARTCHISPLYERCFFLPVDFPSFFDNHNPRPPPNATYPLQLCVSGHGRNNDMLANALRHIKPKNVLLKVHQRNKRWAKAYRWLYAVPIKVIRERDFYLYQQSIAHCHVLLPLMDPETNLDYFPQGPMKKLSGILAQAMAYRTPVILHAGLVSVYGPHLTAPYLSYTNDESFVTALDSMLQLLLAVPIHNATNLV